MLDRRNRELRYVWAVTLVAAAFLARFILQPLFGPTHIYTAFYPVVLIAAYGLGARPAILATALSAAIAYWCFAPPPFDWKLDAESGAGLAVFVGVSTVAIYLVTGLMRMADVRVAATAR
ncbi:MAG TPA: DUF4118 domain-containing protein [Phenylobacterium sp.]|nr:DUF4118 domain-containing protein [Phenylobacterium sp.]